MKLRESTAADTDILYEVWRDAVLATHDFVSADHLETFARVMREDYLPNSEFCVAVDDDDRPRGFMGMSGSNIDALFVDPVLHGNGVGRLLIEYAQERHPGGLTLDVNEQNEQAHGFYERLGFRVVSRSPVDDTGKPYPLLSLAWP